MDPRHNKSLHHKYYCSTRPAYFHDGLLDPATLLRPVTMLVS
jgi:hypothetical protein